MAPDIVKGTQEHDMRCVRHLRVAAIVIAAALAALSGKSAWPQTASLMRIIVPYPPGGGTDTLARLLAEHISRTEGQTMLIENRPGAGSAIGTEAVSRAAPDGNTVLIVSASFLIIPQMRKMNYNPLTSFEPICYLAEARAVILVNSASRFRTLTDLVDAARREPGNLTMAGAGTGTFFHVAFEMLKRAANVNIIYVPYSGGAPAVTALLGGHVTSAFTDYPAAAEQLNSTKLRALATKARIAALPDVPTIGESGYKDYEADNWFGVFAPVNTSKQKVSQFVGWFTAAMQAPEIKARLATLGLSPVGICGANFAAILRKQYDEFGRILREANVKVE
jgi:tripartite-type tricarboxylate transporter receptor subunit TctC